MTFKFTVKFCSPKRSKIIYDKTDASLKTVHADHNVGNDGYCVFYSPVNKLSLSVRADNGEIDGLDMYVGELDNLTAATDKAFNEGFDGSVKIASDCGKLTADTTYMFNFSFPVTYDSAHSVVYIGSCADSCLTVRIFENAVIAVDERDKLCGIAIKL